MKTARILGAIFVIAYGIYEAVRGFDRFFGVTIAIIGAVGLWRALRPRRDETIELRQRLSKVTTLSFWITILLSGVLLWWLVQAR
ncbi:MAG TPA: hypothetical protein VFQ00_03615 [Terriglobales bacterium]|nr:hypothetical protein [Terriglobales bacterium]